MSDLVKRLRSKHCCVYGCQCDEAADRIEQLERELEDAVEAHKVELIMRMKAQRNLQDARTQLAAEKARNEKNKMVAANATVLASDRGFEIESLHAELAAEKALADEFFNEITNMWPSSCEAMHSVTAYRKARGL